VNTEPTSVPPTPFGLSRPSVILGIETSCDESAASVVVNGREVLSSVVSSQIDLHSKFGGVVPEIAGRAHVELIVPVVAEALEAAGFDRSGTDASGRRIEAVAATTGPGLIGSLLVGVSAAKSFALTWDVPFLGVNHLEAHLLSPFLEHGDAVRLPLVTLLVSGGHTLIVLMTSPTEYQVLGSTIDDAAGEAYDKVARFLGLPYPGGPEIDRLAASGEGRTGEVVSFPRGLWKDGYDFSFSGLKTAVVKTIKARPELSDADVAAAFQESVVDVLFEKTVRAARDHSAASIALGGGVAANSALRGRFAASEASTGLRVFLPPRSMCTDNAAMVASAAWWRADVDPPLVLSSGANPSLRLRAHRR
jgi:N6-L-threonylcarbamoyladenine synthase